MSLSKMKKPIVTFRQSAQKKTKEDAAIRQAWVWYREGIPFKGGSLDLKARSLRNTIRHSDVSLSDVEFIINELKRRGFIISCVFAGAADAVPFINYLEEFWDFERSPYIREKLRAEHSLKASGVSEAAANGFSFHGWRHFFTTYMRDKIEDKLLQSQTGHKTLSMLNQYSAHQRSGDLDKIREAQVELFSSLLPSG